MATTTIRLDRSSARVAAEAIHSVEMEGLSVDDDTADDISASVAGNLDTDELVKRVRRRYGLT